MDSLLVPEDFRRYKQVAALLCEWLQPLDQRIYYFPRPILCCNDLHDIKSAAPETRCNYSIEERDIPDEKIEYHVVFKWQYIEFKKYIQLDLETTVLDSMLNLD